MSNVSKSLNPLNWFFWSIPNSLPWRLRYFNFLQGLNKSGDKDVNFPFVMYNFSKRVGNWLEENALVGILNIECLSRLSTFKLLNICNTNLIYYFSILLENRININKNILLTFNEPEGNSANLEFTMCNSESVWLIPKNKSSSSNIIGVSCMMSLFTGVE